MWRVRYPFDGNSSLTSIEIYHTTHNQIETRAPIRTMTFANLNGTSYLVAAYMCTPLVTIPLDALVDGAHVRGKTIAELGFGNTPSDMISFNSTGQSGTTTNILLTNYERSADLMPVSTVSDANSGPGLTQWVPFGQIQGIQPEALPLSGVKRIDNLSDQYVVALRDKVEWSKMQLVTYDKSYFFRSSDYVSEYAFPGYHYPPGFETNVIEPVEKQLMQEEATRAHTRRTENEVSTPCRISGNSLRRSEQFCRGAGRSSRTAVGRVGARKPVAPVDRFRRAANTACDSAPATPSCRRNQRGWPVRSTGVVVSRRPHPNRFASTRAGQGGTCRT